MCLIAALPAIATAMGTTTTGLAISAAGMAATAVSAVSSLRAQEKNSEMQADAADRQAKIERSTGKYNADRREEEVERVLGQQSAAAGASGMGFDDAVGNETLIEGDLDVRAIRWQSNLAAETSEFEARGHRFNAKQSRKAMPLAFAAPILGGMGGMFGGGAAATAGAGAVKSSPIPRMRPKGLKIFS